MIMAVVARDVVIRDEYSSKETVLSKSPILESSVLTGHFILQNFVQVSSS